MSSRISAMPSRPPRNGAGRSAQSAAPQPVAAPLVRGRGEPLPDAVRGKMERALGHDFSRVRIHETEQVRSLGADAIARGGDVLFAPGKYDPVTRRGQELLGHELGHVAQQARRMVKPTLRAGNLAVNDDPALEREAERMGRSAAHSDRRALTAPSIAAAPAPAEAGTMQMNGVKEFLRRQFLRHIRGPHQYQTSTLLHQGAPGENVSGHVAAYINALRSNPAIGPSGPPASWEGTPRIAMPMGRIMSTATDRGVRNETVAGQHLLHPGTVDREVTSSGSEVRLDTHGTGHGYFPSLNEAMAPRYWGLADWLIKRKVNSGRPR